MFVYSLNQPTQYNKKELFSRHIIFYEEDKTTIIPQKVTKKNINPLRLYNLKQRLSIVKIIIEDRTSEKVKNKCIMGQVNRAGYNFLHNQTPFHTFPTFPDMSSIYTPIEGLEKTIVHTLGPDRFKKSINKEYTYSEIVGLVSPVWHYLEVCVAAKTI